MRRGNFDRLHGTDPSFPLWGRVSLVTLLMTAFFACDLAMYDEEAVESARRVAEFELIDRASYEGWDFRTEDGDELIVPEGFYPDAADATTGYVVYEESGSVRVWRLDGDGIIGDISVNVASDTAHRDWDAWTVPIDETISNPLGYRPLFLVGVWDGSRNVTLHAVGYDPTSGDLQSGTIDLLPIAQSVEVNTGEVLSVNVAGFGPASGRGGGTPFSTTAGSELQLLIRIDPAFGGNVKELIFRGSGIDFVDWALGNPSALVSAQGTVTNQFPLPTRSDGDLPVGIRHATDFGTLTGILTFRDGDYSGAPRKTYTWPSDGAIVSASEFGWIGRISSISYAGALRSGRNGSFTVVTNLDGTPATASEENGSIWYAGQFPDGSGAGTPMIDIFTQTGVTAGIPDGVLTVAIYE